MTLLDDMCRRLPDHAINSQDNTIPPATGNYRCAYYSILYALKQILYSRNNTASAVRCVCYHDLTLTLILQTSSESYKHCYEIVNSSLMVLYAY